MSTHTHTEVSSLSLNFVPNDTFVGYVGVKVLSPPLSFEDHLGKLGLLFTRGGPHSYSRVCVHMQAPVGPYMHKCVVCLCDTESIYHGTGA